LLFSLGIVGLLVSVWCCFHRDPERSLRTLKKVDGLQPGCKPSRDIEARRRQDGATLETVRINRTASARHAVHKRPILLANSGLTFTVKFPPLGSGAAESGAALKTGAAGIRPELFRQSGAARFSGRTPARRESDLPGWKTADLKDFSHPACISPPGE